MQLPDGVDVRMVDLARRLVEQTRLGRVTWKRTDRQDRYLYAARTGSVTIERTTAATYKVRALDRAGNEQESLQAALGTLATSRVPADAYATLQQLFEAAEQTARRGSGLIDELIAEIG